MRKSVHSEAQKALGKMLREARLTAGLTQAQLASQLRKRQSFVAKVEIGERRVDVVEFIEITRVLEADPATFLKAISRKRG